MTGLLDRIEQTGFGLPIFVAVCHQEELPAEMLPRVTSVFELDYGNNDFYGKQLEAAATKYEKEVLPPFSAAK